MRFTLILIFLSLLLSLKSMEINSQNQVYIDSLEIVFNKATSTDEQLNALHQISAHYILYDFKKSVEVSKEGLAMASDNDKLKWKGRFSQQLGNTYLFMGMYDQSIEQYYEALRIAEKEKEPYWLVSLKINIGAAYDRIWEYDKALEFYFEGIDILTKAGDEKISSEKKAFLFGKIYNNIGSVYEIKNENEKAIQYYNEGLKRTKFSNDKHTEAQIYNNLGKLYLKEEEFDKVRKNLDEALKIRVETNDLLGIAKSYNFFCDYFLRVEQLDSAIIYANKVLEISDKISSWEIINSAHSVLYNVYKERGNYKEALAELEKYKETSDSLMNKKTIIQISQIQSQKEIEDLEEAHILQQQKNKFRNTIIFIILISVLVVFILMVILLRNKKLKIELRNRGLEYQVELKNKELTTNVMYLVRKNELINSVAKKLYNIQENLKQENKHIVKSIIVDLQSAVDKDVWKEFELRFQSVHVDFYEKLREKHPDLTPNEERLCAFLRLNMTSKEIAAITHQNYKSLDVARARLRKKLNLTGTDTNLVSYLMEL